MLIAIAAFAGLYVLVCLAAYVAQEKLVFYPGPPPTRTPSDAGLAYEPWTLVTRDGERLQAWRVRAVERPGSPAGAILFCHGNAGSIADRLDHARAFVRMGFDVLLLEYRGYGQSTGKPTEVGTYLDAESACDALATAGFGPERLVVYGESLGGAVAIELATRRKVAALVVEDTFTSMTDMGARVYRWLPARLLTRIRYDSMAKVARVNAPILVVHSPDDELVPYEQGERLFAAAAAPKQMLTTRGRHAEGGFLLRPDWIEAVRAFLLRALPESALPGR